MAMKTEGKILLTPLGVLNLFDAMMGSVLTSR